MEKEGCYQYCNLSNGDLLPVTHVVACLYPWPCLQTCLTPTDTTKLVLRILQDTARYAGLLLAPVEGFGQGLFLPFGQKKELLMLFVLILGHF